MSDLQQLVKNPFNKEDRILCTLYTPGTFIKLEIWGRGGGGVKRENSKRGGGG